MADTKVSALAAATPLGTDLLYLVDDPGGTPLSKSSTVTLALDTSHTTSNITGDLNIGGNIVGNGSGMSITGGDTDGELLTITSNSIDDTDPIHMMSPHLYYTGDVTFTDATASARAFQAFEDTMTLNFVDASLSAIKFGGSLIYEQAGNAFGSVSLFANTVAISNADGEANNTGPIWSVVDAPTVTAVNAAVSTSTQGVRSTPVYAESGTGALTVTGCDGFFFQPSIGTGVTVNAVKGALIRNPAGAGNAVDYAGVIIEGGDATTDNVGVLIGTTTIPSGDWPIYSSSTTRVANFQGPVKTGAFSDAGRASASAVPAGTVIFNTDDNFLNVSDGTNWRDPTGATT